MTLIANVEQAAAWDGDEGEHWTMHADRYDIACQRYDSHLLASAALRGDSVVLDIGCGTGVSTRNAARVAAAGHVDVIDLSSRQLEDARRRAAVEGLTNTSYIRGDAQVHPFSDERYDTVISRFGAMFFGEPTAAFRNIARALRPEGRLAVLAWQPLNKNAWVGELLAALDGGRDLPDPPSSTPGPFGLADSEVTHEWLAAAGLSSIDIRAVAEPMCLGTDPDDAVDFVSGLGITRGLLEGLTPVQQGAALNDLHRRYTDYAGPEGVLLDAAAWLITAIKR